MVEGAPALWVGDSHRQKQGSDNIPSPVSQAGNEENSNFRNGSLRGRCEPMEAPDMYPKRFLVESLFMRHLWPKSFEEKERIRLEDYVNSRVSARVEPDMSCRFKPNNSDGIIDFFEQKPIIERSHDATAVQLAGAVTLMDWRATGSGAEAAKPMWICCYKERRGVGHEYISAAFRKADDYYIGIKVERSAASLASQLEDLLQAANLVSKKAEVTANDAVQITLSSEPISLPGKDDELLLRIQFRGNSTSLNLMNFAERAAEATTVHPKYSLVKSNCFNSSRALGLHLAVQCLDDDTADVECIGYDRRLKSVTSAAGFDCFRQAYGAGGVPKALGLVGGLFGFMGAAAHTGHLSASLMCGTAFGGLAYEIGSRRIMHLQTEFVKACDLVVAHLDKVFNEPDKKGPETPHAWSGLSSSTANEGESKVPPDRFTHRSEANSLRAKG